MIKVRELTFKQAMKYYSELSTNETESRVKKLKKTTPKKGKKQIHQSMSCHRIIKP